MSRETVGDEVRSGDLTVEGTVKTPAVNHPDATGGGLAVNSSGDVSVTGSVQVAESIATNRARIVLCAPDDGTRYRHLLGANLDVDASGTYTKPATNISGAGWVFDSANGVGLHGVLSYVSAADDNTSTATPVERMRIDSSGNVGIGTSSPVAAMHVDSGAGDLAAYFNSSDSIVYAAMSDSTGSTMIQTRDSGALAFRTGGAANTPGTSATERMRIDSAGLITGSGTSLGAWTAYTPTLGGTGWAIGNGTATGAYCQIGKLIFFRAEIVFGSTSTFGASAEPTITGPANVKAGINGNHHLQVKLLDSSTSAEYLGWASTTGSLPLTFSISYLGTNSQRGTINSTNPFTWATSDRIQVTGFAEAA